MHLKFIKSAASPNDYIKDDKLEFCFIGRSNVGKSSIINAIANEKVAKTSSTPGRTQLVNFFEGKDFRLVDLPGYGFAKLSKQAQDDILKICKNYFEHSKNLNTIFHICDANVITDLDREMSLYFRSLKNKHYILILNKIDKAKLYWYKNNLRKIKTFLELPEVSDIILVSANKKLNIDLICKTINQNVLAMKGGTIE